MEFGQAYCKDFLKRNLKKFILYFYEIYFFILNFRNSNLNEFDITKILEKKRVTVYLGRAMGFIHEFNIICLFSIYIIYYYETILGQKLWTFLWTLGMLWG
jgi:hypothetical protein